MIALKYIGFAILATLVNLASQYCSFLVYNQAYSLYLALFIGTIAGLVTKYILDKKYIFYHTPQNRNQDPHPSRRLRRHAPETA